MGYTTEFEGRFDLNKKLDDDTFDFLAKLSDTRRMKRSFKEESYGIEGEFYVEDDEENVTDPNTPPSTQPSLWCDWAPTVDGKGIEWNQAEKFYNYVEWLKYLIERVLKEKGYILNGTVKYQGEDEEDKGFIVVEDNIVDMVKIF